MDVDTTLPKANGRAVTRKAQERYAAFRQTPYREIISIVGRGLIGAMGPSRVPLLRPGWGRSHYRIAASVHSKFAAMAMQLEDMEAAAVAGER